MIENKGSLGQIQISDEVIAIIAGTAAMEVSGIEATSGTPTNAIVEFFGKKNQSKGVKVLVENGEATIDIDIAVKFGIKLNEVAENVQAKVKNAVETMTGLTVIAVNINVSGITLENTPDEEETPDEEI